jgi:hypothetical protein
MDYSVAIPLIDKVHLGSYFLFYDENKRKTRVAVTTGDSSGLKQEKILQSMLMIAL